MTFSITVKYYYSGIKFNSNLQEIIFSACCKSADYVKIVFTVQKMSSFVEYADEICERCPYMLFKENP